MWRKTRKQSQEKFLPLSILSCDEKPVITFPGEVTENIRQMVTRISYDRRLPERLSVFAALREEGVTYVAQALAAIIANDYGARVCVVDLNWWWPSRNSWSAEGAGGLAAVLSDKSSLMDAVIYSAWPNLALLPAGKLERQNRPVFARGQKLKAAIDELSSIFDHLILDIPAVRSTSDAVPLASYGTAGCLVIRHGVTGLEDVHLTLDEVKHIPLAGVIMNRVKFSTPAPIVKLLADR